VRQAAVNSKSIAEFACYRKPRTLLEFDNLRFQISHSRKIMFPKELTLERLNAVNNNTLTSHIGIEFIEIGSDYLVARMPVDERTIQPYKILHGGASVVLSESLGSQAAAALVDLDKQYPVGLEINANHIKSVSSGYVYGRVTAIHIGRSTHVWETRITNEENNLICISKLTVAILDR
jgi:uncharacterized protein (TIGR00369 family)